MNCHGHNQATPQETTSNAINGENQFESGGPEFSSIENEDTPTVCRKSTNLNE